MISCDNNRYALCNIYKITSPNHEKMYIGSTFKKLQYRFAVHKSMWNKASSKHIIQAGNAKIELVETIQINDDDKRSRYLRERYWINIFRDMGCPIINKHVPGRTQQEYYRDNKDKISKFMRDWYQNHKTEKRDYYLKNSEKLKAYQKERYLKIIKTKQT